MVNNLQLPTYAFTGKPELAPRRIGYNRPRCPQVHRQLPGDEPWPYLRPKPPARPPARERKATSSDSKINVNLSPSGSLGPGTNPEQLFAAGYSACFGGAIGAAASLAKVPLRMADIKVTATVRLHKDDSGFFIDAEMQGVDQKQAEALVAKAHTICPYSKATRGNIEVKLLANGKPVDGRPSRIRQSGGYA